MASPTALLPVVKVVDYDDLKLSMPRDGSPPLIHVIVGLPPCLVLLPS